MVSDIKDNGTFLLNCPWSAEELDQKLPAKMKRFLATHNINFYTIDAVSLGKEIGLGNRINMIMQAAFFKLANIIPIEDAVKYMKKAIVDTYGKKGDNVINMNYLAVDKGIEALKR
jgi:pyruvate-ferredoxin/flavodoxin oxidoreductase